MSDDSINLGDQFRLAQNRAAPGKQAQQKSQDDRQDFLRQKYKAELSSSDDKAVNKKLLQLAEAEGPLEDISFLYQHKRINLESHPDRVMSAAWLFKSAKAKDPEIFDFFFEKASGQERSNAMAQAASEGDFASVNKLLEKHVDPNRSSSYGPPLLAAIQMGQVKMARLLVASGADINTTDAIGRSAGDMVYNQISTSSKREMLQFLADSHYNFGGKSERNIVAEAVKAGKPEEVEFLLKNCKLQYKLHERNEEGDLPQNYVMGRREQPQAIALLNVLHHYGADFNLQDKRVGRTLLHQAIISHETDVAEWLLQHGADPAIRTQPAAEYKNEPSGYNGLHLWALNHKYAQEFWTAKYIINANPALLNGTDDNGTTPLMLAAKSGSVSAAEFLLANNARLSDRDKNDKTVFDYAKDGMAEGQKKIHKSTEAMLQNLQEGYERQMAEIREQRPPGLSDAAVIVFREKALAALKREYEEDKARENAEMNFELENLNRMEKFLMDVKNGIITPEENLPIRKRSTEVVPSSQEARKENIFVGPSGVNASRDGLYEAIRHNNVGEVRRLIEGNPESLSNLYEMDGISGCNLLHIAAKYDCVETARFLVEAGVKTNQVNGISRTPLSIAAENNSLAVTRTLIEWIKPRTPEQFQERATGTNWNLIEYALSGAQKTNNDETLREILKISDAINAPGVKDLQTACEQFPVPACKLLQSKP